MVALEKKHDDIIDENFLKIDSSQYLQKIHINKIQCHCQNGGIISIIHLKSMKISIQSNLLTLVLFLSYLLHCTLLKYNFIYSMVFIH